MFVLTFLIFVSVACLIVIFARFVSFVLFHYICGTPSLVYQKHLLFLFFSLVDLSFSLDLLFSLHLLGPPCLLCPQNLFLLLSFTSFVIFARFVIFVIFLIFLERLTLFALSICYFRVCRLLHLSLSLDLLFSFYLWAPFPFLC